MSPYADLRLRALIDLDARRWESRQAHPLFNGKCRAVSIPGNERTLELENPSKSHRRLRNAIADASSQDHYRAGFKTDITQFYPSLLPAIVDDCMQRSGFPSTHAAEIRHWLDWIGSEGFTGVPIGPELSIVFANLALARADRALRAIGVSVLRWTDDYVVLGESVDQADDAFAKLKQELLSIGLRLHPAKTEFFRTPEEVAEFLASRRAVSLEPLGLTRGDPLRRRVRDQDGKLAESPALTEMRVERAEELFLSEFDREVGVGERERWLRYHLKVFLGLDIVSQHIADELLCHPDRWVHACPVVSAYLRASMTDAQALRALYLASDRASDDFEEQAIHLLHACRGRQYGAAEAEWLLTIARTVDSELLAGTARALASDFSDVPSAEAIEHGELDTLRPYEQRWAIGGLHLTQRRKR